MEHFREHTRHKIGGRGKAMVVTSSRLHAVRYKQAIDRYIADNGYADTKALVAFCGKVDDDGVEFTESGMNGFPESQTAKRFDEPEFGVLIVAEKFQTGYDQPLLHTMFVDKMLTGLDAVQTLSRLNRIHPEKTDTFVLDFRNEADAITEAFKPWYEQTVAIPTDPNLLHDLADALLALQVLDDAEARAVAAIIADRTARSRRPRHGPCVAGAGGRTLHRQDARGAGGGPRRGSTSTSAPTRSSPRSSTSAMSGSRRCTSRPGRSSPCCPRTRGGRLDLGSEVELTHLRLEKTSEGEHHAGQRRRGSEGRPTGATARRPRKKPSTCRRSSTSSTNASGWSSDRPTSSSSTRWRRRGSATTISLPRRAPTPSRTSGSSSTIGSSSSIVERMDDNADIFGKILDDDAFKSVVMDHYLRRVFEQARVTGGG